jgi:O-antigen ligase
MHGQSDFLDYEPVNRLRGNKPNTNAGEVQSISRLDGSEHDRPTHRETKEKETSREQGPERGIRQAESRTNSNTETHKNWLLKRGHAISYAGLFLFTLILYFRPYELFPSLSWLSTSAFWVALATLAVFVPTQLTLENRLTARPREVNLILLLTVAALLSIPLAIRPGEAWNTFNDSFIKAVLIFIIMVNVVRTETRLRWLVYLSLFVGVILSANAINDYRLGNLTIEGYRVKGLIGNLFGNPNDMAIHLVMMFPIAVGLMMATRNIIARGVFLICAMFLVVGTMLTYSRGGFLGLVMAGGVLSWKLGRRNRAIVLALSVLALVGFMLVAPGHYGLRILSIFDHTLDPVASAGNRQAILTRSIIVALRHPLLGIGMGNFHIMSVHELVNHNSYLQVATEIGLPAMIFYILFTVTPLKRLRRLERETVSQPKYSGVHYLAIGLQASLLSYMVTSFFGSVAYLWYVYYLVGYALCLSRLYPLEGGFGLSLAKTSPQDRTIEPRVA